MNLDMQKKSRGARLRAVLLAGNIAAVFALAPGPANAAPEGDSGADGLTWTNGLVVRGGACSANAFKEGSGVTVYPPGTDNLFGLSVNCTTATGKKADYPRYTAGIPHTTYCVATIQDLERVGARLVADPLDDRPLHCLLNGNAKEIAKKLTRYP